MIPMAFVAGCGHTGTTLLANMLAAHPRIYVPLVETRAFLDGSASRKITKMQTDATEAGAGWIVEKTPQHVFRLDQIRQVVRDARFLLTVRDPRDVIASLFLAGPQYAQGNIERACEWWQRSTEQTARQATRPDVLVVRYEDLITETERELRRCCEHVGAGYDPAVLEYHKTERCWFGETSTKLGAGHRSLRNWQVNQPILDRRGRWRELPPEEVEVMARFLGGANAAWTVGLGYPWGWGL